MIHRIVYQEIKKIFSDKKVTIFMLLLILLQISVFASAYNSWINKVGDIKNYNLFANERNGKIDWSIIDSGIINSLNNDASTAMQLLNGNIKSVWKFEYHCAASRSVVWNEEKSKLETDKENPSSIVYNRMLDCIGEPEYSNCSGLNAFNQNISGTVSALFINILVILIISPLFIKEKNCNMDVVISASYLGKNKNTILKIISAYLCASIFIIVYYLGFLLLYLSAFDNWKALHMSMNVIATLYMTPYKLSIIEYLVSSLIRFWIGTMTSVTITCALSINGKKIIGNIIKNFIALFIPIALPKFGIIARITSLFPLFAMQGYFSYSQYIDYNIGNMIVTYRGFSIGAMIFVNIILLCIIFIRGKKYEK